MFPCGRFNSDDVIALIHNRILMLYLIILSLKTSKFLPYFLLQYDRYSLFPIGYAARYKCYRYLIWRANGFLDGYCSWKDVS